MVLQTLIEFRTVKNSIDELEISHPDIKNKIKKYELHCSTDSSFIAYDAIVSILEIRNK